MLTVHFFIFIFLISFSILFYFETKLIIKRKVRLAKVAVFHWCSNLNKNVFGRSGYSIYLYISKCLLY